MLGGSRIKSGGGPVSWALHCGLQVFPVAYHAVQQCASVSLNVQEDAEI